MGITSNLPEDPSSAIEEIFEPVAQGLHEIAQELADIRRSIEQSIEECL